MTLMVQGIAKDRLEAIFAAEKRAAKAAAIGRKVARLKIQVLNGRMSLGAREALALRSTSKVDAKFFQF